MTHVVALLLISVICLVCPVAPALAGGIPNVGGGGSGTIIPIPAFGHHASDSRKNIDKAAMVRIVPGQTTREEVFLSLGEPDLSEGASLTYRTFRVWGFWLEGAICHEFDFIITFDSSGVVSGKEVKDWGVVLRKR